MSSAWYWWGACAFVGVVLLSPTVFAQSLDELQEELRSKQERLKEVTERIGRFKEEIQLKKKEAKTLADQISVIEDTSTQLELSIEKTLAQIEETSAEIAAVAKEIERTEEEIQHNKELLAEYLKTLYLQEQQSTVTIFLKYGTFSEAVNEASTLTELQTRSRETLITIKQLRDELQEKQNQLEDFKQTLEDLQQQQERQLRTLSEQQRSKEAILDFTQAQEREFKALLAEEQRTHQQSEAEIKRLDTLIREELKKQGAQELPSFGVLDWPIEPIFGIACVFHCPDYPYAYLIGPHAGIDIPTYVGTPIKAPADGYVARTHDSGGPGYSYLLLLHGDNMSTVYGHLSSFAVNEGTYVTRGTTIGFTGGSPGSRGAGLSSGPHLHFEVRKDNVPVNPQQYL